MKHKLTMEGGNEVMVVCRSGKTLAPLKKHESRAQAGAYVDRNIEAFIGRLQTKRACYWSVAC